MVGKNGGSNGSPREDRAGCRWRIISQIVLAIRAFGVVDFCGQNILGNHVGKECAGFEKKNRSRY